MQFKNIGEFLKLAKKTTGITELSNLAKSIGNVNDVASALKNISNLSDDLKVGILSSMDGVNAEMARTVLGIKQVGDASTTATSSVTGLGSAIVGAFKTHPILMVVTAITAVVGAIYGVSNAIEKARFEKAQELTTAFDEAKTVKGKPTLVVANTTKGMGSSVMENKASWHHHVPSAEEYEQIMKDLKEREEAARNE